MESINVTDVSTLAAAPVIVALLQLVKTTFPKLSARFVPLTGVILAVAWVCAVAAARGEFTGLTPLFGVMSGLSATGLFELSRKRSE